MSKSGRKLERDGEKSESKAKDDAAETETKAKPSTKLKRKTR